MFIDLLISLFVAMSEAIGFVPSILVLLVAALAAAFMANALANWFAESVIGGGQPEGATGRRRGGSRSLRRRGAEKAESLDDAALRRWAALHPSDSAAARELCRRLRQKGDPRDLALQLEHWLRIDRKLPIEERCMAVNQLADIYLDRLEKPERAREILAAFTKAHSGTLEADLAGERARRIAATEREGKAEKDVVDEF